jgi:predicted dehydrogenase
MKILNWGILGPGKIAHKFTAAVAGIENARIYAVASRSIEKANQFAKQYGAQKAFGSYEEMINDAELDVVYIATPHSLHYDNTLMCLNKGIPVLCEKPFTINSKQLNILVDTARKKKVFLMEGIWTRFLPTIETTLEILKSGHLGKIKVLTADFGFRADYDPDSRLFNPALGGGSLLDIGIYPVFLSLLLLGYPDDIKAVAVKADTGVDKSMAISLKYNDGTIAGLNCTFAAHTETAADVYCEKGHIHINPRWVGPSSLRIYQDNHEPEEKNFIYGLNGYVSEVEEVMRCLNEGLAESPKLNLDFSLQLMKLLDELRRICGVSYPLYD